MENVATEKAQVEPKMLTEKEAQSLPGLTAAEAALRLKKDGFNELPSAKPRLFIFIVLEVLKEPMLLLLLACSGVYLFIGDINEAFLLLGSVVFIFGINIYQEQKTERTLESLKDLSSPRALVIRDGKQQRVAGREVVQGDIMILAEGDRIPADATLIWATGVQVDESLLTGESVSVRKVASDKIMPDIRPGGDDLPDIFSGTLIVKGQGTAEVTTTGIKTEIGKIGKALNDTEPERAGLQTEIDKIVRIFGIFALVFCITVVVIFALSRGDWLGGTLAGLSLAMSMMPEEFPIIFTVFMALGAWRMAKKRVLTRQTTAIETLGSTTVLCVDKTGTLTENKMTVRRIFSDNNVYDTETNADTPLPEVFHLTAAFSILASPIHPFDPMEIAFKKYGEKTLAKTEHLHSDWTLIREYPLSPELLALSQVWKQPNSGDFIVASKGAPEAIMDLCHLPEESRVKLTEQLQTMTGDGLRVLGVACADFKSPNLPENQHDFEFRFLGFIGLEDPPRKSVSQALKECYTAGIRVVMITGDYAGTAQSIAKQIGFQFPENVITGKELESMTDEQLQERIKSVSIFARVIPEQKLRIVNLLKTGGEIVAMTGDGVNDAPALKSAHIGIAMGGRGTDVAREAAALVLLDDDFTAIQQAVKMGRRIFDNLRKAMAYTLAVHVPIAGMSLLPVLFGIPLVLLPVHIVFMEFIIDSSCAVVFEAEKEESTIMSRPPRRKGEPLFTRRILTISILQGFFALCAVFLVFFFALQRGLGELDTRTMAFITLITSNVSLMVVNRSWQLPIWKTLMLPNTAFWVVLLGTASILSSVLYIPPLQTLFHFSILSIEDIIICLSAGLGSVLWFEIYKFFSKETVPAVN